MTTLSPHSADAATPLTPSVARWSPRKVASITLTVLMVGLAFWAVYRFQYAVFMLLAAMMLRVAIKPAVEWLRARGLKANLSVAIVFGVLFLFLVGIGALVMPLLAEQSADIANKLPQYYVDLRSFLAQSSSSALHQVAAAMPADFISLLPQWNGIASRTNATFDALSPATAVLSSLGYGIFLLLATLMMTVYWTLDADRITRALLMRVQQEKRDGWRDLITELEGKVGSYFRGQLLLCGFIFVLSTISYFIIGLPYALVLGLLAGLFEALPMIGPFLGMIPALVIALATDPQQALWVVVSATLIQQVESNFLVPRVMDKSVGINPIVSILAIAAFSLLFGWVGALLAIPVAAMLQILIARMLFRTAEETEERVAQEAMISSSRNAISLLRLETRELADDVRKQVRKQLDTEVKAADSNDPVAPEPMAMIEDTIETMALDLDEILAKAEAAQQQNQKEKKNFKRAIGAKA